MNWNDLWQTVAVSAAIAALIMFTLWAWATRKRDASVVDVAWSALLGAMAIGYPLVADGDSSRRWLVGLLGGVWGTRLAWHLLVDRVLKAKHEDGRYQELRAAWGAKANTKFFVFFQAQGLLAAVLSIPFAMASFAQGSLGALDIAAAVLWGVGFVGETIADRQLAAWRRDPKNVGRTCRGGLWRYSRHPNYFCEWLMWVSYALLAMHGAWGWTALLAPCAMLFLIMKVTGIPPTEARALRSRGDEYRQYQATTSAFFPWPPKNA